MAGAPVRRKQLGSLNQDMLGGVEKMIAHYLDGAKAITEDKGVHQGLSVFEHAIREYMVYQREFPGMLLCF